MESSRARNTHRRYGWQQSTRGELLAELAGTFVLVTLGCGSVAMAAIALPGSGRGDAGLASSGDWLIIAWGWGMAVTFGVYVAGGVTGAHINPAVTLAQAVFRDFSWRKVLPYMAAQFTGGLLGAGLIFLLYNDAISAFEATMKIDRGSLDSAASFGVFATSPAPYHASVLVPLLTEIVATAFLVGFIFAATDELNTPVRANLAPLIIGLIVFAIALSLGANSGYAINPVRDLAPRVMAWFTGWGEVALPGNTEKIDFYMWVPIVGPLLGGLLGGLAYDTAIKQVLDARGETGDPELDEKAETVIER